MRTDDAVSAKSRILIVDDDRLNIMALTAILRVEFELIIAPDGAQALTLVAEQRPDLILLDVVMPHMNGHEVCRQLKQDEATQSIPIIFISGRSQAEDETLGFELGAVDYIAKPFNELVVISRVRSHARLKRQSDLLERMVMSDALTGIPNRRAFDQVSEREWQRCRRTQTPLSLLMIDVDMFKQFNDNYGHGAGDTCLILVGRALAACTRRPGDFVARYGGEEFVAVLADATADEARGEAERFLSAVTQLEIAHAYSLAGPVVSVSIGVATTIPSADKGIAGLKEAADQMLYEAKKNGRNRLAATDSVKPL